MSTPEQRLQMAAAIVDFEARRDKKGRLAIYKLPKQDGGGTYEVAGINERYHPNEAAHLAELINDEQYEAAENEAREYIALFTDHVALWTNVAATESYLRDCSFNRGPRGCARILQRALNVDDDGKVGPHTLAALDSAEKNPLNLLSSLRAAREQYERQVVGRDESSIFWKGLVNRWNNALEEAKQFLSNGQLAGISPAMHGAAVADGTGGSSNFFLDVISKDSRFKTVDRIADAGLLEPRTRASVQAIIGDAKQLGINLMIFETYRSKERQKALFDQGATQLKNVGVHHYGLACDLVKNVNGQPSWKGDFSFLRTLGHHHGLVWGGDWGEPSVPHSFVDSDHVQRVTKGRQASLFSGAWYPDGGYDPYQDGAK
ncbi:putative peptidoglycan-binding domain-containing protein [Rhizobium leguminosarum]|nr:putative peptidoglycan-binding domain-containing protein [Rhizobium leguminosarum]